MHTLSTQPPACTLTLSRRQAEALAAVLVHVADEGEGAGLDDVYCALVAGGAEVDAVWSGIEGGRVVVTRDAR